MLLDLKTLSFMVVISSILYAITIAFFASQANQYKGITLYMWGAIFAAIGFLLMAFNTPNPKVIISFIIAYFFISAGYFYCLGIVRFLNPIYDSKYLTYFLVFSFIVEGYLIFNQIKDLANIGINFYLSIFYGIACYYLWKHRLVDFANSIYFMLFNLIVIILVMIVRSYAIIFYNIDSPFANTRFNIIFFLIVFVTAYLRNIGFIMMVSHRLYQDLRDAALHDFLTQIYNRRAIQQLLDRYFKEFKRYHYACAIILLDIDYFKAVNDNYGHEVGDKVLQKVTYLLKTQLRKTDILGRWGGEEFLILLPHTSLKEAYIVAEKLRQSVAKEKIADINCTISLGVNVFKQYDSHIDVVIKRADDALYKAKSMGRNCAVIVD